VGWWSTPRSGRGPLYPRDSNGTHCMGGCVGPSVGLNGCEQFLHHADLISDSAVRSGSLEWLRYSGLAPRQ
jgi:hypothetical protein